MVRSKSTRITTANNKRRRIKGRKLKSTRKVRKNTRKGMKQKGGRKTFLPQDIVNFGRSFGSDAGRLLSDYQGLESAPHSGPTLGHPISR